MVTSEPSRRIAASPKLTTPSPFSGDLGPDPVERLVLDEDHGVVVADRRLQQVLGVHRRGGTGDEQSRNLQEHRLEAVRVCRAELVPAAAWHPTTRGTRTWPPNMYGIAAAWLTIWSIASSAKLTVMISTIGRRPPIAAPTPIPTMEFSEIGGWTRFSPELVEQPLGDLEGSLKHSDVLSHDQHVLVAAHLLSHRVPERLRIRITAISARPPAACPAWSPSASRSSSSSAYSAPRSASSRARSGAARSSSSGVGVRRPLVHAVPAGHLAAEDVEIVVERVEWRLGRSCRRSPPPPRRSARPRRGSPGSRPRRPPSPRSGGGRSLPIRSCAATPRPPPSPGRPRGPPRRPR